jgi:hypothetical protein
MDDDCAEHEDRGVDDGVLRYDDDGEVHEWPSVAAWAEQWWTEWHTLTADRDRPVMPSQRTPASDYLGDLAYDRSRGPEAVDLVVALSELAATEQDMSDLGAGDIETLLAHHERVDVLDHVEACARRHPRFAEVLTYMWVRADVGEPMRSRLLALGAIDLSAPGPLPR